MRENSMQKRVSLTWGLSNRGTWSTNPLMIPRAARLRYGTFVPFSNRASEPRPRRTAAVRYSDCVRQPRPKYFSTASVRDCT
jgi:hypothetical protein